MPRSFHIFTSNGDGAGKSISLLNALGYFLDKRRRENREEQEPILVFDANVSNPNVFSSWLKRFRGPAAVVASKPISIDSTGVTLEYYTLCNNLCVAHPVDIPTAVHPFQIIKELIKEKLDGVSLSRAETILIDSHLPLHLFADGLTIDEKFEVDIFSWIVWPPFALDDTRILHQAKEADKLLSTIGSSSKVFHVFNPKLLESEQEERNWFRPRPVNQGHIRSYNEYRNLQAGNEISMSDFVYNVEAHITESPQGSGINSVRQIHEKLGEKLNLYFAGDMEENKFVVGKTPPTHRYKNIFAIRTYDPTIALLKYSQRALEKLYIDSEKAARELGRGDCIILGLPKAIGSLYTDFSIYLESSFPSKDINKN